MATINRPAYRRPMPRSWWLRRPGYFLFMLREFSSVFLALFVVLYLVQLLMLALGREAYDAYLGLMQSPWWIALHVVIFAFALIHAVTWIFLMPAVAPTKLLTRPATRWAVWAIAALVWAGLSVGIALVMLNAASGG